jgi:CubicO group peptidase (beta-lactamase class C family)
MERLNRYLDTLEARGFSGAVLVELDSSRVVSRGYGLRDRARGLKNTPTTVFDIGSITKQFTAAALLTLEMQGKLRVGDSLGMYFPNSPADKACITLHQLLRHASGLPSTIGRDYEKISARAFVDSVINAPLLFTPGTRFGYSNIGYSLLAMIIEKVSGQPYEEYLYANLWKPSGMESTGYRRPQFNPELIAVGYDREGNVWGKPTEKTWDNDGPFWHLRGNGGILSTTEDLARWHHALLSETILTPAARTKYYHPALRSTETTDSYYAYGWDVHRTPRNTLLLRHNGANGIFYADFARYIDDGVTIIALMNQMHPNFRDVNAELARMVFDPAYMPPIPIADNAANRALTASLVTLSIEQGAERGLEAYTRRARGEDLIEFRVNERGYDLLRENQYSQAIEVFRLNVFAFPESDNAYDSLGEAYLSAGLTDRAIENYRKSVALNPGNMNAIEILKTLTGR